METCKHLKEKYEDCFNIWFSEKFLKGDNNDSMCASLLKVYTDCVEVRFKRIESKIPPWITIIAGLIKPQFFIILDFRIIYTFSASFIFDY